MLFNVLQCLTGSCWLPNPIIFFHILYADVDWSFAMVRCFLNEGGAFVTSRLGRWRGFNNHCYNVSKGTDRGTNHCINKGIKRLWDNSMVSYYIP